MSITKGTGSAEIRIATALERIAAAMESEVARHTQAGLADLCVVCRQPARGVYYVGPDGTVCLECKRKSR